MSILQFTLFLLALLTGILLLNKLWIDYQTRIIGYSKKNIGEILTQDTNVPFVEGFQMPTHVTSLEEDPERWYEKGEKSSRIYSFLGEEEDSSLVCSSCGSLSCNSTCPLIGRNGWRQYHESPLNHQQDTEIEELREVLNDTIGSLKREEVIPPGTIAGCAKPPIVSPDGTVMASPECRPPGWLRFMEKRNRGLLED
jgi:crotonobetainyl-CoA:carnitine CoA-transferase CaiB-like acyl-CoA transferase